MAVPATVDFFSLLGVDAAMGLTFATQDLNSPCTVVLAHSFWEERLDSASSWIGKSLTLDGKSCTVVGVMPKDFSFYPKQTELWTLIAPNSKFSEKPWDAPILTFGLLKPGISRPAGRCDDRADARYLPDAAAAWVVLCDLFEPVGQLVDLLLDGLPLVPQDADQVAHHWRESVVGVLKNISHRGLQLRWPLCKDHAAL